MAGIDIMVTPTLPVPAPYLGQDWLQWPDGEETVPDALVRLTAPFNVTGQPALSLPCGTSGGRPLGLQLIGHAFQEGSLLRVAAALEGALRRRPVPDLDEERRCAPDPAS
jgi:aspartyl-tRNA(Asn)/glutamyl-tRNA(Gln) amidotransferase subunit A